jgi:diguanylate cyclase (GGDEF)-like protein/PAS domain S-box-containing protein
MTGALNDADFIKFMHEGAHDIVLKSQGGRLAPVLERELTSAEMRRQKTEATEALKQLEEKHSTLIAGSQEAVGYSQDGMHTSANPAYLALFGYESEDELMEIPVLNLIDKADQASIKEYFRKPDMDKKAAKPRECRAIKKDGTQIRVQMSIFTVESNGEKLHQIIASDISADKSVETKMQFLNQHDPLTGLNNRHHFMQAMDKAVAAARAGGACGSLLYINLEQLGRINTDLGFATGDRLLLKAAKVLRDNAGKDDVVARFGGDEFTLLLQGADETRARAVADSIGKELKKIGFSEGGKKHDCRCCINVTPITAQTENTQQVLTQSYLAYIAARQPAAPAPVAAPPVAAPAPVPAPAPAPSAPGITAEDAAWKKRIGLALKNNGFQLMYQPIVNLHGDPAEAYEVLLRMKGDKGEIITAAEFIPAAERLGLSQAIDHWVVENAIGALQEHHKAGIRTDFFINLSVMALKDASLALLILKSLKGAAFKADSLVFEIQENVLVEHPRDAATFIDSLKKLGCRFAVDDFGTRISSFGAVQNLGIQYLKLDGRLIQNLTNDTVSQTIVQALFQVAKALDRGIIAKSVQDAESLALLWNYGADYVQGNYFQAPSTRMDYVFAGESIDSDQAVAGWAKS